MEKQPISIIVHEKGGFLGIDRTINFIGDVVTVFEHGTVHGSRRLSHDRSARISELAIGAAEVGQHIQHHDGQHLPSDGKTTNIVIEDGSHSRQLNVTSGDTAPKELWNFLDALNEVALEPTADRGTAPGRRSR